MSSGTVSALHVRAIETLPQDDRAGRSAQGPVRTQDRRGQQRSTGIKCLPDSEVQARRVCGCFYFLLLRPRPQAGRGHLSACAGHRAGTGAAGGLYRKHPDVRPDRGRFGDSEHSSHGLQVHVRKTGFVRIAEMTKESSMEPANPRILTINGGSSSIKFALFEAGDSLQRILEGGIERIGLPQATLRVKGLDQADNFSRLVPAPDHTVAVGALMDWIEERSGRDALTAVGHRVVHGGPKYYKPQRITAEMVTELKLLSPFDPDHMPEEILLTEAFHRRFPDLPQVACFDTAFHHDLPRVAQLLPIPRSYEALGVRRYGFHGLSYAFLMEELARLAGPEAAQCRVILAHLGNGASLAAVRAGKSMDTTMSFTPTAGVPMSTRSGDLDPGLVWYLTRTEKMSAKQFNEMVNFQSGLLGISETSSDMRDLLRDETQGGRAAEAVALFCYEIKKWVGAFAAALGGLDTLVFAGGIGENVPPVRARICDGMKFLGIELEEKRNGANEDVISAAASRVAVRVIHTDEERMIAKTVCRVLGLGCKSGN